MTTIDIGLQDPALFAMKAKHGLLQNDNNLYILGRKKSSQSFLEISKFMVKTFVLVDNQFWETTIGQV